MATLSVEEAVKHLSLSETEHDGQLADLIDAAEALIAGAIGPLELQPPVTERVYGRDALVLGTTPVHEVTAVDGFEDLRAFRLDGRAGLLRAPQGRRPLGFRDVTYIAGREELPADVLLAIKEMVRHLWHLSHGGSPYGDASAAASSGPLPKVIEDLLARHRTSS